MAVSPRSLIEKLNPTCKAALEKEAIPLCMARTHFHVELEHWLTALLGNPNNDVGFLLRQYAIDAARVKRELEQRGLDRFKTGNTRAPGLSADILDATREAWVFGSLEVGAPVVRSAHLLYAVLADRNLSGRLKDTSPELARISVEKLAADIRDVLPNTQS
ncbi:MAG: type VI secretion system ATPase TssH, partial [Planctomycetes bacterium]|nr:type VI secretion system ATPase TssH [Planctomycetota bacterium]